MKDILKYKNIIAAAVIIFVFFLVIRGIVDHYAIDRKKIIGSMEELAQGRKTIEQWESLSKKYSQVSQGFLKKDNLLFKKYIEERAQALDIEILSLRTDHSEAKFYWDVSVQLLASCLYADFIKFTEALEEKSIKIKRLSIDRQQGRSQIRVAMSLETIVLK